MTIITDLHPIIQATVLFLAKQNSLQEIAVQEGVTKQAIHKRVREGIAYLRVYPIKDELISKSILNSTIQEVEKLKTLVSYLRRELILGGVERELLRFFKSRILQFFPRFKNPSLSAHQKQMILEALFKFRKAGGVLKDFAKRIDRCSETISRWEELYRKNGISGLITKKRRPKNFGNKIPAWVKDELLRLFAKFPRWTPYQYHSHIRHNPGTQWYVSIPTITKLKQIYLQRSEEEKNRIKKRWCFAPGSTIWTLDFTCIFKTNDFKLQLLTTSDHRSRFLFPTALFLHTSTEIIVDYLEELFIKFGKPDIIKVDNGPEFRLDCKNQLIQFAVYLMNSPEYYGQFNGAHERIHRTLKAYIDAFSKHHNLTRLLEEIRAFENEYDYSMTFDYLEGRTPANVYFNDQNFTPKNVEIVTPYEKDGELRMKFKSRDDSPVRLSMPIIMGALKKLALPSIT